MWSNTNNDEDYESVDLQAEFKEEDWKLGGGRMAQPGKSTAMENESRETIPRYVRNSGIAF